MHCVPLHLRVCFHTVLGFLGLTVFGLMPNHTLAAELAGSAPGADVTLARTADGIPTRQARQTPMLITYLENDTFGGTDQHYTNGFKAAWVSPDLTAWGKSGWRQRFLESLPFVNRDGTQKNLGLAVAQHIFTPQDTARAIPDPTDRPYAGWSYLEFSFLAKTDTRSDTIAVQLGIVGPHSYADDIQIYVHELLEVQRPNGWRYQLPDEPGVNIAWERKWRTYARTLSVGDRLGLKANPFTGKPFEDRSHWGIDFIPHLGAVVGNVSTFANAGAVVRMGYNLPSDFGVNLIRPAGLASAPVDDIDPRVLGQGWSIYLFASADSRAIARNIFLDGSTFRDSPRVSKKTFVADYSYGVGLIYRQLQLTFTQVYRTREFDTQVNANSKFGSVSASWAF